MNVKQTRTLKLVFCEPVPAGIDWSGIEHLLIGAGCDTMDGHPPHARFTRRGMVATFHQAHHGTKAKRYQVRDARAFLLNIGVQP